MHSLVSADDGEGGSPMSVETNVLGFLPSEELQEMVRSRERL